MPFLILPRALQASDALLDELGTRLCPYTERPRRSLEGAEHAVLVTPLVREAPGRLRNSLSAGTAGFEVRVEGDALYVTTDPLGTCPIWYLPHGEGWVVSPEVKAIAAVQPVVLRDEGALLAPGRREPDWSPYEDVRRLPPGCSLRVTSAGIDVEGSSPEIRMGAGADPGADWPRLLGEALAAGFRGSDGATGAFVSGGIDSTLACALARRQGPVATITLGTRYGDEFEGARAVATGLDCTHHEQHLDAGGARVELERAVVQNEVFDGLTAEILMQLSALYRAAEGSCARVATGYGSDLLFDGMLRHAVYMDAVGLTTTPELIERTRWTGELAPFLHWSRGIAAEHVFWSLPLIELALRIPRELCFADGVEKRVLRDAAVRAGLLPEALAFRPKVGMTDGTGANRLLSEVLDAPSPHGYLEKSRVCIGILRRALGA